MSLGGKLDQERNTRGKKTRFHFSIVVKACQHQGPSNSPGSYFRTAVIPETVEEPTSSYEDTEISHFHPCAPYNQRPEVQ